jgi:transcription elongation GreA/GreB family factor
MEQEAAAVGFTAMNTLVKKRDDERAANLLPDRPIPSGPNLATPEGLAQIEEMLSLTQRQLDEARAINDVNEIARTERDLRYWTARRSTAEVVDHPRSPDEVQFGTSVTIRRDDGREQTFRIVGTDEANPAKGTLSQISPLARALLGKKKGDLVEFGIGTSEVTGIH